MPNKDTTPLSLYGNDREYLREQEKTNELLADIAGEEYESPGDIPNGKYVIQKRLLDAAQKKNELLESIAEGGGTGGSGAARAIGIDYATDIISLKNKNGETIAGSGATLPAYGVSFDPITGGLTLTKNGTAVSGQTVTIPNYGSPVGVTSSSDMTDEGTIYLYEGTTGGGFTNGHFYYYDGTAWADGGEYAAATVQTDKTLLVEDRAADAKATGEAVGELKTQITDITGNTQIQFSDPTLKQYINTSGTTVDWTTPSTSSTTNIKWAVVECDPGDKFTINGKGGSSDRLWAFADSSKTILNPRAEIGATATDLVITAPANAAYLIINDEQNKNSYVGVYLVDRVNKIDDSVNALEAYGYCNAALAGKGSTLVRKDFLIITGHSYRITVLNRNYTFSGDSSATRFQITTHPDGGNYNIISTNTAPASDYVFTSTADSMTIYIRADVGQTVLINITDITDALENRTVINNSVKTLVTEDFAVQEASNSVSVSWSRLYVRLRNKVVNLTSSVSVTLSNSVPLLILRNFETVTTESVFTELQLNDIVLLVYYDGMVSGGLLYPYYTKTKFDNVYQEINATNSDIDSIEDAVNLINEYSYYDMALAGKGSTLVRKDIRLTEGNTYQFTILNPDYTFSGSSTSTRFQITTHPDGGNYNIVSTNTTPSSEYIFTSNADSVTVYIRADEGQVVLLRITDISAAKKIENIVNKDVKAFFTEGFAVDTYEQSMNVRWTRLYLKFRSGYSNFTDTQSFTLSNDASVVLLRNYTTFVLQSEYASIQSNDIVLLVYQNGEIVGGLLYPYYVNNIIFDGYSDDARLNAYRNALQLGNIKWTPKAQVIDGEKTHPANVEVKGIPYSSVKEYLKYVGIDVSLHTFMTAVNDIHSLMYTETPDEISSRSDYGRTYHGVNSYCYFGTVCSGYVTTALGSLIQYNSWEFRTFWDRFKVLDDQNVENLQVGDILSEKGHCEILLKVNRKEDGSIRSFIVGQQAAPISATLYTPSQLTDHTRFRGGVWCRYDYLHRNTNYKASPFVRLGNEQLYNVGDFAFIDGESTRTFYRCKVGNNDSEFTPSHWDTMEAFAPNTSYSADVTKYVSHGENLYYCIETHTSGETFDPTKWQQIYGIVEWASYPYTYNNDIVTFAGDRAAFHSNDLIYINYAKGSYTSMQIYKNGTLLQTISLPSSGYQINVSEYCSGYGMYKARLTDGTNYSRYTYYEVIDSQVSATYSDDTATVTFSSANGKPVEVQIVEQSGFTVCHMELTPQEISNGEIIINPKARLFTERFWYMDRYYDDYNKKIYARIMFSGEFGNVVNEMIELGTLTPISGNLVYPDNPVDIGIVTSAINVLLTDRMNGNRYDFSFEADSGAEIAILPSVGVIKWASELPQNLVTGTTYLVHIENGIGSVTSVT